MRSPNAVNPRKDGAGNSVYKRRSYIGLRTIHEHGDEEAPVESVGYAVSSKCMREGAGGFQESTRLRHCGEGVGKFTVASHDMEKKRQGEWGWCMRVWKGANSIEKLRECTVSEFMVAGFCTTLTRKIKYAKKMHSPGQPNGNFILKRCRNGLPRKVEFVHV